MADRQADAVTHPTSARLSIDPTVTHLTGLLWTLALLTFLVGDTLTTVLGLHVGLIEAQPVAERLLSSTGWLGMVGIKLLLLCGAAVVYRRLSTPSRVGIPAGLVFVGSTITAWNVVMITQVIG